MEHITGRNQGRHSVLAYHIRQSFKPCEIDAETANKIGHRLALSFIKGKDAYIMATHIDKAHIHNHIIFNLTTLNCEGRFNDPKRSGKIIRRISDRLCAEHATFLAPGQKKPTRLDTMGNDYNEAAICERLAGTRTIASGG